MAHNNHYSWSKPDHKTNAMYPPQKPTTATGSPGLTRFSSAPGSFLTRAVDSVIGSGAATNSNSNSTSFNHHNQNLNHPHPHPQYFSSAADSSSLTTSESTCKLNSSNALSKTGGLQRSYGFNEIDSSGSLLRQNSSPAGFLSHLNISSTENGFSITPGTGGYNSHNSSSCGHAVSRLKSQLSFTRQDSLSQISEVSEDLVEGISSNNGHPNSHSYSTGGFGMGSWDNTNSIVFSGPSSKRMKNIDGDIFNCINGLETQFSLPQTSLEMATVEKLLNIPEDSVPCKIRAKRGCATHPRSIAERERRTRISGRLKKLQDLVPNMDKQTSYSDMLDLAVQHIKGLQGEVEKLHKEMENCSCGCKPTTWQSG
ncbi:transcription factor bHLH128-like [Mercurialis annua]|uniref:transcription factor bHLH128-like n=1 Tax=Mercurialis annua TaxID=3986 RepID=UPI00215F70B0|nr:transcription factor bHLH128-like [Mercurialis annua]